MDYIHNCDDQNVYDSSEDILDRPPFKYLTVVDETLICGSSIVDVSFIPPIVCSFLIIL